jgi:predicted TIM-barrel fold metal-dependent hydrolase
MTTRKHFTVFDGDSHVVEPRELWEKYLDPEYRVLGKSALWREEGKFGSYLKINGEMFRDTDNINLPRHAIWRPGMTWDTIGDLDFQTRHAMNEGRGTLRSVSVIWMLWVWTGPFSIPLGSPRVPSGQRPWRGLQLARGYSDWIASFCRAAQTGFRRCRIAAPEHGVRPGGASAITNPMHRSAFSRPMFVADATSHILLRPLWADLANLGVVAAVHATQAEQPEWTSHGPFIEDEGSGSASRLAGKCRWGTFFRGGSGVFTVTTTPLGHSLAPILAYWLDNYLFVASTLLGYGVMNRYPTIKVVLAHGKATWMDEVLEKFEASTRVISLQHYYPIRTDAVEMREEGHAMLGFDADERGVRKLPERYSAKVVWGSRYPHDDTTSAWDAIDMLTQANVAESCIAKCVATAEQFGIEQIKR